MRQTWGSSGKKLHDFTLYTGALGTAFLVFKAYKITLNQNDLKLCSEIIKACDAAARGSGYVVSFHLYHAIEKYMYIYKIVD